MGSLPSTYRAHRCSFRPDRVDPYLRLSTVTVFVRDQESSLRFYLDQLGFCLAFNVRLPSGDRWLAVAPPDGTALLALVAPKPDSEEYKLIGRSTQIDFLTEDVFAKFEEWRQRGVRFEHPPEMQSWGATSTSFEKTGTSRQADLVKLVGNHETVLVVAEDHRRRAVSQAAYALDRLLQKAALPGEREELLRPRLS